MSSVDPQAGATLLHSVVKGTHLGSSWGGGISLYEFCSEVWRHLSPVTTSATAASITTTMACLLGKKQAVIVAIGTDPVQDQCSVVQRFQLVSSQAAPPMLGSSVKGDVQLPRISADDCCSQVELWTQPQHHVWSAAKSRSRNPNWKGQLLEVLVQARR